MAYTPIYTEFRAQLRRSCITQTEFAQRFGYTVKAVNNWCNGRRLVPPSAWALARAVDYITKHEFYDVIEKSSLTWQEILGCRSVKDAKKTRDQLAKRYHPDYGGSVEAMQRINAAYEQAMRS